MVKPDKAKSKDWKLDWRHDYFWKQQAQNMVLHSCEPRVQVMRALHQPVTQTDTESTDEKLLFWCQKSSKSLFASSVKCSRVRATFNTLFTSEIFSGRCPNSTETPNGKDQSWMVTFSFCLNSPRNFGMKVSWFTVRHKMKFYLLHRRPAEIVAESYSNRYMNWRSPFKGLNSLRNKTLQDTGKCRACKTPTCTHDNKCGFEQIANQMPELL